MVNDQQVRRLLMYKNKGMCKYKAADKAGMSERTAYKYIKTGKLPSHQKAVHNWRTRQDVFENDWTEIEEMLCLNSGLESKTIFRYFQDKYPERYEEGQLRTLQRKVKRWRATEGPGKEVYFPQIHYPGRLCASDFTHMNSLGITICGEEFNHLVYHFVLTYSNWESITICYSESFESLSAGLQNALWELGGVPQRHRSDRMSAAVNKDCNPEKFTQNYQALLRHYEIVPERTNANSGNENGDVESSHRHFKNATDQALMLRGSRDFRSIAGYESFLREVVGQRNTGRLRRFREEMDKLKSLPGGRVSDYKEVRAVKISKNSTVHIQHNTYSVHSRLRDELVDVRIYVNHIEIWYAQKKVENIPRLRGASKFKINYRHIIGWLVRKPGAFENYRYKEDLYPSSWFRIAYDWLKLNMPMQANKQYVKILYYAAKESQEKTEHAIRYLIENGEEVTELNVKQQVEERHQPIPLTEVNVQHNNIELYDQLLGGGGL